MEFHIKERGGGGYLIYVPNRRITMEENETRV